MTNVRIAGLLRKLSRTREPTKRAELEYQLAQLGYKEPAEDAKAEPPADRKAPEHVTTAEAAPRRGPGRPRKNITGSGSVKLPRTDAGKG